MSEHAAWAIVIATMAGCTVGEVYIKAEARKAMTPQQMCMDKAWTHADRVECMKAPS